MAWLGDWAKRIEITVSNTNIDSNLTHFPLMLKLGSSVGTNNDDVTAIFDELTSDANRKKIAVTKSDGTTQIYVEIEKWDDANETAFLWVSKSDLTLSSSGATTLYIYYDSSQPDNTTYVGDVNSTPGASVWDSNFKAVYHLSETSGGSGAIKDSTSNDCDGTDTNSPTLGATGKINGAIDFELDNSEYIQIGTPSALNSISGDITLESWIKSETTSYASEAMIVSKDSDTQTRCWYLEVRGYDSNKLFFVAFTNVGQKNVGGSSVDTNWKYLTGAFDSSEAKIYLYENGSLINTTTSAGNTLNSGSSTPMA